MGNWKTSGHYGRVPDLTIAVRLHGPVDSIPLYVVPRAGCVERGKGDDVRFRVDGG